MELQKQIKQNKGILTLSLIIPYNNDNQIPAEIATIGAYLHKCKNNQAELSKQRIVDALSDG